MYIFDSQIRDSGLRAQVSVRNTSHVTETGASLVTVTSQTVHVARPSLSMSGRCVSVNPWGIQRYYNQVHVSRGHLPPGVQQTPHHDCVRSVAAED